MSSSKRNTAQRRPDAREVVFALLALAGLGLSLVLARIHAQASAGAGPSFCSLGEAVNCDRVALSPYSVFLGIPLAFWGAFGYASMLLMALVRLRHRNNASSSWPTGLLLLLSGAAALATVPLALASAFVLRSLCILCAATWLIDWALFGLGWRQAREVGGPAQALAHDLHAITSRPARTLVTASVTGAVLMGGLAAYSMALTKSASHAPGATRAPPPGAQDAAVRTAQLTIFEFSDYECPHCARAHRDLRAALANRPDVHLEHRNFPLDQSCNPAVQRPFHRTACALARAAICAGNQGRFWEMNDALYANQGTGRSIEDLAAAVGLDVAALRRCQVAPETVRRLDQEIASGMRAGVTATPTYAVGRALYQGSLPANMLGRPDERSAR
jgi:protein-disulfide isomerase